MPLVINALGGRHTHTDVQAKTIQETRHVPGLKTAVIVYGAVCA